MKTRLTAILLCLIMVLGLFTGCGKESAAEEPGKPTETDKPGQQTEQLPKAKFAYKASYFPLTTHNGDQLEYANYFCTTGNCAYYTGSYSMGMITATDPITGEELTDENGQPIEYEQMEEGLFRMDLDTKEVTCVDGYEGRIIPEGMEGDTYISSIFAGTEGTIWVQSVTNTYSFDLPEDFDAETEEPWNYYTEGENYNDLNQYDANGMLIQSIDLRTIGEDVYVQQVFLDDRGYIYAGDYNQTYILDSTGALKHAIAADDMWLELTQFSASQIGVMTYSEEKQCQVLKVIDPETGTYTEELELMQNAYNIMPGFGEYQYLYHSSDNVYGVKEGAEAPEKLFSWLECDVDSNNVNQFSILSDGRVAALERDWSSSDNRCNLILMEQVDPATLPQKQELVLGCLYLDYDLRPLIVNFNRTHSDVRIVIKDYSEQIDGDNYQEVIQKMNTEIVSGAGPDLIATDNIPLQQYAAKGVLVDLWPLIDGDSELGREDLMTHLFDAMSIDGKLYQVVKTFSMQTAAVNSAIAQGRTSWTLDELLEARDALGPDVAIFGETDTKAQMLTQVLSFNLDHFMDWNTGTCSFDSEEFISILEFANTFPKEFDYENYDWSEAESEYSRLQTGKQLMSVAYIGSFDEMQVQAALHGGNAAFIGFPSENGQGSCFNVYGGLAISSGCTNVDAAWSFLRELLLEENQIEEHMYQFPTNRTAFETYAEQAMTPQYTTDPETGEQIEVSTGGIGYGDDFMVDLYAMKQEEYDAFMALYESCTNVYSYNDEVMTIILEEAAPFFEGQKTAQETASLVQNRLGLFMAEKM